jgi:CRP-like cAMP-binding protein
VKISTTSISGKDAVFNLVSPPEIFGEIALLDGRPRTADANAITDCELMVIERRDFVPILPESEVALRLIELLCSRLRQTSEQMEDLLFLSLPSHLAKRLLSLAEKSTLARGKVSITQRDIGQIIGMSREGTNKQLRHWEKDGWLRLERGGITILDHDSVRAVAEAYG